MDEQTIADIKENFLTLLLYRGYIDRENYEKARDDILYCAEESKNEQNDQEA